MELLCRQKCHVFAVYTCVCIVSASIEEFEMDAGGHLVAVELISDRYRPRLPFIAVPPIMLYMLPDSK